MTDTSTEAWAAVAARDLHNLADTLEALDLQPKLGYGDKPDFTTIGIRVATTGDVDKFAAHHHLKTKTTPYPPYSDHYTAILRADAVWIHVKTEIEPDPAACTCCGHPHTGDTQ